ncbi:hypothetical protein G6514_003798 [Epicoccum nigrum]|nr:hypothetical protein G6514_003798 [Epicoccum nigrum]
MAASTIIKVEAYANEYFREDFSRLPAVKVELVEFDYTKLRIEDKVDITVNHLKDLHYNPDQLRDLKPFCWVDISFEQYQKLEALLTYYVLVKYSDVARIRSPYFTDDFKLACADVAKGLRAAEAAKTAVDNPSNRGITPHDPIGENNNHTQQHQSILQVLADNDTLKEKADAFKELTAHGYRISTLETQAQASKTVAGEDDVDWVRHYAAAKVENEDPKSKLAIAEEQIEKMAKENAELHKKLAVWFGGSTLKKE